MRAPLRITPGSNVFSPSWGQAKSILCLRVFWARIQSVLLIERPTPSLHCRHGFALRDVRLVVSAPAAVETANVMLVHNAGRDQTRELASPIPPLHFLGGDEKQFAVADQNESWVEPRAGPGLTLDKAWAEPGLSLG